MTTREAVEQLLEQAYTAVETGDAEQAIVLGNQLLEHRHARGFEVIALAYEMQGRCQEAIDVLRDGVSKVPGAWPLWELLGNFYSDAGQSAEAHSSYQKALACNGADTDSINYNLAVLLKREQQFDKALQLCDAVADEDLLWRKKTLRLSLLRELKQFDAAIELGNAIVQELMALPQLAEENMEELAKTYAELGRAHWEGKVDRQAAWENAWKALEWDRAEPGALWLVREIIGKRSHNSRHLKLLVEGRWHFPLEPEKPPPGFITTYEIVADNVDDAMQFARDLEPVEVRPTMRVDSYEDLGAAHQEVQGVYWRSGYGFYMN